MAVPHRSLRVLAGSMLAALALVVAAPAEAAVYTIHLKNGTTFETRYEPFDAPWDAAKTVFTNEWGNLMTLAKVEIDRVESEVEASGFGHMLDSTTIALGWAPNDAPAPGTEGAAAREAAQAEEAAMAAAPAAVTEPIYDVNQSPPTLPVYPVYPGAPNDTTITVLPPAAPSEPIIEPPH